MQTNRVKPKDWRREPPVSVFPEPKGASPGSPFGRCPQGISGQQQIAAPKEVTIKTIELADGGLMLYDGDFLSKELADRYFDSLRTEIRWEQKPGIFGHMQPRLIASYGDAGIVYRYSGSDYTALPWTSTLLEIKQRIEAVQGTYNYCLLNLYRHGSDSMGWHADDEPEMGPVIGSVSLGATRKFRIRHNTSRETQAFAAGNGTLIIMAGTMQQFWQHEVPKTKQLVGERINLTFRKIGVHRSLSRAFP